MFNIGAKAPGFQMNLATRRMLAKEPPTFLGRFGQQINRPVQADSQQIIIGGQAGKAALIFQIGAIAPKAGQNHLAAFRVQANITRQ